MKLAVAILFVLPLGGLAAAALAAWSMRAKLTAAGFTPTWRVLIWARVWGALFSVPPDLFAAVLHNEGASTPHATTDAETEALAALGDSNPPAEIYPLGDLTSSKGPALGPGQVLWVLNVQRLAQLRPAWAFFVSTDGAQLARVGSECSSLYYAARMLQECLAKSNGDKHTAARLYNGSGSAAEAYATKADTFEGEIS